MSEDRANHPGANERHTEPTEQQLDALEREAQSRTDSSWSELKDDVGGRVDILDTIFGPLADLYWRIFGLTIGLGGIVAAMGVLIHRLWVHHQMPILALIFFVLLFLPVASLFTIVLYMRLTGKTHWPDDGTEVVR